MSKTLVITVLRTRATAADWPSSWRPSTVGPRERCSSSVGVPALGARCVVCWTRCCGGSRRFATPDRRSRRSTWCYSSLRSGRAASRGQCAASSPTSPDALPDVALISLAGSETTPPTADEISRIAQRTPLLAAAFTAREVRGSAVAPHGCRRSATPCEHAAMPRACASGGDLVAARLKPMTRRLHCVVLRSVCQDRHEK